MEVIAWRLSSALSSHRPWISVFACLTMWLRGTTGPWNDSHNRTGGIGRSPAVRAGCRACSTIAYKNCHPWTLVLFFRTSPGGTATSSLSSRPTPASARVSCQPTSRLEWANLSFASALVATLDARDRYTAGHSAAVAIYSRDIATRMELPVEDQQQGSPLLVLSTTSARSDFPSGSWRNPGALTLDERRQMQEHSAYRRSASSARSRTTLKSHESSVTITNGSTAMATPTGLWGDDIPLLSRIIAVADAYNAMTVAPTIPRCDAQSCRAIATRPSRRDTI